VTKFDGHSDSWSRITFETKSIRELLALTEDCESENIKSNKKPRRTNENT
jgi:hypothetical protein